MIGVSFPGVFSSSPFTYSLNPSVWFLTTHLIPLFLMFLYFQASSLPTSITVILKIITPTCVPVLGMVEGGLSWLKCHCSIEWDDWYEVSPIFLCQLIPCWTHYSFIMGKKNPHAHSRVDRKGTATCWATSKVWPGFCYLWEVACLDMLGIAQYCLRLQDPDLVFWTRSALLRVWPGDQQHQHHPGARWGYEWSDSTSAPPNQSWSPVLGKWGPGVHSLASSPGDSNAQSRLGGIGLDQGAETLADRRSWGTAGGALLFLSLRKKREGESVWVTVWHRCPRAREVAFVLTGLKTETAGRGGRRSLLTEAVCGVSSSGGPVRCPLEVSYHGLLDLQEWLVLQVNLSTSRPRNPFPSEQKLV